MEHGPLVLGKVNQEPKGDRGTPEHACFIPQQCFIRNRESRRTGQVSLRTHYPPRRNVWAARALTRGAQRVEILLDGRVLLCPPVQGPRDRRVSPSHHHPGAFTDGDAPLVGGEPGRLRQGRDPAMRLRGVAEAPPDQRGHIGKAPLRSPGSSWRSGSRAIRHGCARTQRTRQSANRLRYATRRRRKRSARLWTTACCTATPRHVILSRV